VEQEKKTHSVHLEGSGTNHNKGKSSNEEEPDSPILQIQSMADFHAVLLSKDELSKESEDEIFEAGDDMETDAQTTEQLHQEAKESTPQEDHSADSESSCPANLKKYDNTLPLTARQLLKFLKKSNDALYNGLTEDFFD
jgi:hypothetical protein